MPVSRFKLDGRKPVFGFISLGGPIAGALVRDVRLANELSQRGYRVHIWWAVNRLVNSCDLRPEIHQHWLFNGLRYAAMPFERPRGFKDHLGRAATSVAPKGFWSRQAESRPWAVHSFMRGMVQRVCTGVEEDGSLIRSLARQLTAAEVTHVLPMVEMLGAWPLAAKKLAPGRFGMLVTFQGYEVCINYARKYELEGKFIERLREIATGSDWPAVAVSRAYLERAARELDIAEGSMRVISPGVPAAVSMDRDEAKKIVAGVLDGYDERVPMISYLGRRDAEKGLDLLLYAANMLHDRGVRAQLAIVGPSLHGPGYVEACGLVADNLRLPVLWHGQVTDRERDAIYAASRVVVYPPIHGEPFGMVPVEAMAFGTPVVVPDRGGIAEVIEGQGTVGGSRFREHDTASLAEAMAKLLGDEELWKRCSADGPRVAAEHSVERMTDAVLGHMGLPLQA